MFRLFHYTFSFSSLYRRCRSFAAFFFSSLSSFSAARRRTKFTLSAIPFHFLGYLTSHFLCKRNYVSCVCCSSAFVHSVRQWRDMRIYGPFLFFALCITKHEEVFHLAHSFFSILVSFFFPLMYFLMRFFSPFSSIFHFFASSAIFHPESHSY